MQNFWLCCWQAKQQECGEGVTLYLCFEQGPLPHQRVSLVQSEDSEHDKQVVLADVALLLEVWAGAARVLAHSHSVHCSQTVR